MKNKKRIGGSCSLRRLLDLCFWENDQWSDLNCFEMIYAIWEVFWTRCNVYINYTKSKEDTSDFEWSL